MCANQTGTFYEQTGLNIFSLLCSSQRTWSSQKKLEWLYSFGFSYLQLYISRFPLLFVATSWKTFFPLSATVLYRPFLIRLHWPVWWINWPTRNISHIPQKYFSSRVKWIQDFKEKPFRFLSAFSSIFYLCLKIILWLHSNHPLEYT